MSSASAALSKASNGSLDDVVNVAESAARLEAQRVLGEASCMGPSVMSSNFVTRDELKGIVGHLSVMAETHASMQLAVTQLKSVCPELGRLISVIKVRDLYNFMLP